MGSSCKWGKQFFMDPMPARERKQIHHELENNRHVKTYSRSGTLPEYRDCAQGLTYLLTISGNDLRI